jgi:ribonuclease J
MFTLRFVPLGGVIGVTKNMYLYELYKDNVLQDILIVDCGIGFPHEKELGVDFVIPDITYLKDKTDKIRAILLTHGHEDHISALPFHYEDLGRPPVYASKLTAAFVANKCKEFNLPVDIKVIAYGKQYQFGDLTAEYINITHSIPDTTHILIGSPLGQLYHGSDFKLDVTPVYGQPPDFYRITKAGHDGILCLMSDCLGSQREGLTQSEAIVGKTFEDEMRTTKGKFVMTTFSSNISRIRQCVEAAIKFNRKIVFLGRSMRDNTMLAKQIDYLPIPAQFVGKEEEVMQLPPNKVCLIVAGSQGQYGSALSKLANKQHRFIKVKQGDKVVISSDPIPGNENEVYALIEELTLQGAHVVYSDIADQLHASGHGNQEDLKFLMRFTNPQFFIPIGGTIRHQQHYRDLAGQLGFNESNVLLLNEGETIIFQKGNAVRGDTVDTKNIYVDAYGIGDIGSVVLRDRKTLSSEGMVVCFLAINKQGGLVTRPKFVSKGFVFAQNESELFEKAMMLVEKQMKPRGAPVSDFTKIKRDVITHLEDFFYNERGRRPLIVVETMEI